MQLRNRVALVTGAAGGLGYAYAEALAEEGADIVAVDVNGERLSVLGERVRTLGRRFRPETVDLTDRGAVRAMAERVMAEFNQLHILVNNAGGDPLPSHRRWEEITESDWDRTMAINLKSALWCCQAFIPVFKANRYGKIINISSRAARSYAGYDTLSMQYIAAKLGVIGLTRQLAKDLGEYGINVNCICPGFTISSPHMQALWDGFDEEQRQRLLAGIPLRRLPELRELARTVVFLASDDAGYITGATIDVSGGGWMS